MSVNLSPGLLMSGAFYILKEKYNYEDSEAQDSGT